MALIALTAIWEYQTAANTVPPNPAAVVVPAAGWTSNGVSPFGQGIFTGTKLTPPATVWARNTGFWMRRGVTVSGQAPILVKGNCEQAMYMYWNGTYVGMLNPTNAARSDVPEYNVVIPETLATAGTHTLAVLCLDDADVADPAISYISLIADYAPNMIPLQPEAPVTEELQWVTDVMVSKNGSEQRLQIDSSPRQKFNLSYPANTIRKVNALNTIWGGMGSEWLVPIWTQAQRYGAVSSGLTTLPSVNLNNELRSAGLFLLWESDTVWQILGFDSVTGSDLNLNVRTNAFTNAWLMPLRYGFITENVKKGTDGYEATFDITFDIIDNQAIATSAPTQFLSEDLYTDPTLLTGKTLSDDILSNVDTFDPGFGLSEYYKNWTNSKIARTYRAVFENATEVWEFKKFLHRRAGRNKAFWQPSFENDMIVKSTGTIASTMNIKKSSYMRNAAGRNHIAVEANGVWYPRTITLLTEIDADTVQLTLSSALNVAVTAISRVSWLGLRRLNTDKVEIRYIGNGVSETSFRTLEVSP